MKKIMLALLVLGTCLSASFAQTINDANAEKRPVTSFHGIEVGTGIILKLTAGNEDVAVSAATTEVRDRIVTKVENGILKIYYDSKNEKKEQRKMRKELRAYVSYKMLDALNATTGAQAEIVGVLKTSTLEMKVNTGAIVKGEIDVAKLSLEQTTGSIVDFSGKASDSRIDGTTGSIFKGENILVTKANASVSTGAIISLNLEKELAANANTGGHIRYKGNPSLTEIRKSTGGAITKI